MVSIFRKLRFTLPTSFVIIGRQFENDASLFIASMKASFFHFRVSSTKGWEAFKPAPS